MLGHVAELYRFRALIATLVLRDLRARYRGSFFGFLWSFLNPLLLMLVYALVFAVYLRVPMDNYAVFLFSGLLPWLWFSSSLGHSAAVIVGSGGLVKRIMFPAEILPLVVGALEPGEPAPLAAPALRLPAGSPASGPGRCWCSCRSCSSSSSS